MTPKDANAAAEKAVPEWMKGLGLIAVAILGSGGSAYFTGSNAVGTLQTRFSDFERNVTDRLIRVEVELASMKKQVDSQGEQWALLMENKIRLMVKPDSLK